MAGVATSGRRRVVTVVAALAVLIAAAFLFQRYTAYGIFAAGGARYWVARAAAARTADEAKAHLTRVVSATQYGVNAAENAVAELPTREDRIRLWGHLIDVAPNENWRQIYRTRLQREQQPDA